jgi:cytochrome c oxidase assembly protein subunit 15
MAFLETHDTNKNFNEIERNRAQVRFWLYGVCLLVILMVVVGGATRLTDSGLSITEWKPIHGAIPPLNTAEWLEEFEKYKQIPEYKEINEGMSLDEFKAIFWWEWAHRLLGRFIGFFFFIPLVFFWLRGKLENHLKMPLIGLLGLGGLQGFIGWWMVSSGLVHRVDVSQYRLAVHLVLACIIFAIALWIARGLAPHSERCERSFLRWQAGLVCFLILFQIYLGALVAGLDAGLAFNDWPLMDDAIVPDRLFTLEPWWKNLFENPKTVQFIHRCNAYLLFVVIILHGFSTISAMPKSVHAKRALLMMWLAVFQVIVGVITLVLQVPLYWALMHQFLAMILFGFALAHWRGMLGSYERDYKMVFGRQV